MSSVGQFYKPAGHFGSYGKDTHKFWGTNEM